MIETGLAARSAHVHAVARLRAERLARCVKPWHARGSRAPRCERCRVPPSHCVCALRPAVETRSGMCLLMHDIEPLKPTNTGWLVADVVRDTAAFPWARTEVAPGLLELLADPERQPYVVFPAAFAPGRAVREVSPPPGRRPLFVLLDATWPEARWMFRKTPCLDGYPVLGVEPSQRSRYHLRRVRKDSHLCTAEAAALCLMLAGEAEAARALDGWLDDFVARYLDARENRPAPGA